MYKSEDLVKMAKESPAIPNPQGYQVLIAIPEVESTTKGGVYIPDEVVERERVAAIVGAVVDMGPDAYNSESRFPSGPYCGVGDWVIFRSYAGLKFQHNGVEFRFVGDENIVATVTDPREIVRT